MIKLDELGALPHVDQQDTVVDDGCWQMVISR